MNGAGTPPGQRSASGGRAKINRVSVISICVILHSRRRRALARWLLVAGSLLPMLGYGVVSGASRLDHSQSAPVLRSGLLVAITTVILVGAHLAGQLLTAEARERLRVGPLLRREHDGPRGRWASWYSIVVLALAIEYLFAEQRPGQPSLAGMLSDPLPASLALVVLACAGPFLCALAADMPVASNPFSVTREAHTIQEDEDVVGAIGRLSPPLLLSLAVVLAMFTATVAVGAYSVTKLIGGLGITALFVAGLLAAPGLLRAPGMAMEPLWLPRGYAIQVGLVVRLRRVVASARRVLLAVEVLSLAVALGSVASGSTSAVRSAGHLVLVAFLTGSTAAVLQRMLWLWAAQPSAAGPVLTDALAGRERQLLTLAGGALLLGACCSLAAVLSA
jgi:hypothetical protein